MSNTGRGNLPQPSPLPACRQPAHRRPSPCPEPGRRPPSDAPYFSAVLAIPHYIVLFFLDLASFIVVIVAWFAILITGRYPRGMFGFVEGVIRWNVRVTAYTLTQATQALGELNSETEP